MSDRQLVAHTPTEHNPDWHPLDEHLLGVARRAEEFGRRLGIAELAHALGIAHDSAKADKRFQAYLYACHQGRPAPKCPHAHPSAVASYQHLGVFALAVAGHHAGMPDSSAWLQREAEADERAVASARRFLDQVGANGRQPNLPEWVNDPLAAEMLVRMAFSCLVDADRLDTEAHTSPQTPDQRFGYAELSELKRRLDTHLDGLGGEGRVHEHRRRILASCRAAAANPTGMFDLQVPTGGGKTLSGMAFALDHAVLHGLRRVVVAIPYTSIIDQTAEVYGSIFGADNVLEHHSAVEWESEDERPGETERRAQLAAENWDCPLVVTTTVQLFESLHSHKPGRCRKLHNLAGSVILLDEVQTLPEHHLGAILNVLGELVRHYGCSVVFSTATLPDLTAVLPGLVRTPLVPDYPEHFAALRRVQYELAPEPWTHEQVAEHVRENDQVLVVVNLRKDAVTIARLCQGQEGLFHLSTLLCGHHRKAVIREIRRRLTEGLPVRLISTQVVEAGVDVDFPVAMRAMGPLDRIIQVAGRCNREGKLDGQGRCIVFELDGGSVPKGAYASATTMTRTKLREFEPELWDSPDTVRDYTRELLAIIETGSLAKSHDEAPILKLRAELKFRSVGESFRMIDQETHGLVVESYSLTDEAPDAIQALLERAKHQPRGARRKLAPYTVSLYQHEISRLRQEGLVREHESGLLVYTGAYDPLLGLSPDLTDPSDLIA